MRVYVLAIAVSILASAGQSTGQDQKIQTVMSQSGDGDIRVVRANELSDEEIRRFYSLGSTSKKVGTIESNNSLLVPAFQGNANETLKQHSNSPTASAIRAVAPTVAPNLFRPTSYSANALNVRNEAGQESSSADPIKAPQLKDPNLNLQKPVEQKLPAILTDVTPKQSITTNQTSRVPIVTKAKQMVTVSGTPDISKAPGNDLAPLPLAWGGRTRPDPVQTGKPKYSHTNASTRFHGIQNPVENEEIPPGAIHQPTPMMETAPRVPTAPATEDLSLTFPTSQGCSCGLPGCQSNDACGCDAVGPQPNCGCDISGLAADCGCDVGRTTGPGCGVDHQCSGCESGCAIPSGLPSCGLDGQLCGPSCGCEGGCAGGAGMLGGAGIFRGAGLFHMTPFQDFLAPCDGRWFAGIGFYFIKPHWETNPSFAVDTTTGGLSNQVSRQFSWELTLAPTGFIGYTGNNGFGWQASYTYFDETATDSYTLQANQVAFTPQPLAAMSLFAVTGDQIDASHSLNFQVADLELSQAARIGNAALKGTFGGRYLNVDQSYQASVNSVVPQTMTSNHNFSGFGPTVSVETTRLVGTWKLFGNLRQSVMFGDRNSQVAVNLGGGQNSRTENNVGVVSMSEVEAGIRNDFRFNSLKPFFELSAVGQYWSGVGNGANANLYSPQRDQAMGLIGGRTSVGLTW